MKITNVETAWISMPLPIPRGLSGGPIRSSTDAVCRITTDDGIRGIGESRGGPLDQICEIIDTTLNPLLLNENPVETEHLWQTMYESLLGENAQRPRDRERRTVLAAIAAVDLALWDIKGKMTGMSICELLGGHPRPMPAYLSEGFYIEGGSEESAETMLTRLLDFFMKDGQEPKKLDLGYHITNRYSQHIFVGRKGEIIFGVTRIPEGTESAGENVLRKLGEALDRYNEKED